MRLGKKEVSARPLEVRRSKYSASHCPGAGGPRGPSGPGSSWGGAAYATPVQQGGKSYTEDKALEDEALGQADVHPGLPCYAPPSTDLGPEQGRW